MRNAFEYLEIICTVIPETSHWPAADSVGLYYFWRIYFWKSNSLSPEMLAENGFWHEIATQGHSRSFILQTITGRQGVAYRHIILLALSLQFPKKFQKLQGGAN